MRRATISEETLASPSSGMISKKEPHEHERSALAGFHAVAAVINLRKSVTSVTKHPYLALATAQDDEEVDSTTVDLIDIEYISIQTNRSNNHKQQHQL
ncbi:hypothetical protein PoB_005690600 [Plakobranchus ocellatus]|uniref:Uncharacterized protein n=1 Tax=Plakobranchus ocellatus TaxID=259542 RepID=A0AAV4C516_9GAST|nr:hypothetical protein PoB_005690600 [Plakobranchus ocellatus]